MSLNTPDIPSLSSQVPPEIRRAFDSIRGWFSVARKEGGVVTAAAAAEVVSEALPPGLSDFSIPLRLTGFTATGAFRTIILTWDASAINYRSFSYVEIWRHTADDLGAAELVGTTSAAMFSDAPPQASRSVTYYYWGRAVNKAGIKGPYNATAGTPAHTADDPGYMLELLAGEIRETELHSSLTSRITTIESDIDLALANIGTISTSDFSDANTYNVGALVKYQGEIYKCILDINSTPAPLPTNETYWTKVGQYASLADMVSATASGLTSLDTRTDSAEGTITAHSDQLTALESTVNNPTTGVVATAAGVSSLSTRVTSAEGSISSQGNAITGLTSRVDSAESGITGNSTAIASLDTRVTAAEGVNTSQGAAITGLDSRLTTAEGTVSGQATAITGLTTRVTAAEGSITTQASQITSLTSRMGAAESAITSESSTRASADAALSSSISTLTATVNGNTSAIQTEQQVRATTTGPNWQSGTTYTAGKVVVYANALYQCISNHLASAGNAPPNATYWKPVTASLYAQYMVKTDVNGKVVGFGLANDGATSSMEIVVDKFAIVKADGTGTTIPFAVNDAGQVLIREALIQNLTSANIAVGGITADSLSVTKLSAVSSDLGTVTAGTIQGNTITGGTMTGTTITGGVFQTNTGNAGVTRLSGETLVVKDQNGVTRVKLGYLL